VAADDGAQPAQHRRGRGFLETPQDRIAHQLERDRVEVGA
jgi:hypothetical protein